MRFAVLGRDRQTVPVGSVEAIAESCAEVRRARVEQGLPERLEHIPTLEYIADILDEAIEAKARQERYQALLDARA